MTRSECQEAEPELSKDIGKANGYKVSRQPLIFILELFFRSGLSPEILV
jgi:hypothetical protein